jgi:DNA mismatch repair ATPase MutS
LKPFFHACLQSSDAIRYRHEAMQDLERNSFNERVALFAGQEDANMESGKWDEELSRMSDIVDKVKPNSLLLLNESFASTNEREGSQIAAQIVHALLERGVKIFFVTHLHQFARGFLSRGSGNATFLRAERNPDGTRTFKLIEAEPLQTSYGPDLYEAIFGEPAEQGRPAAEKDKVSMRLG